MNNLQKFWNTLNQDQQDASLFDLEDELLGEYIYHYSLDLIHNLENENIMNEFIMNLVEMMPVFNNKFIINLTMNHQNEEEINLLIQETEDNVENKMIVEKLNEEEKKDYYLKNFLLLGMFCKSLKESYPSIKKNDQFFVKVTSNLFNLLDSLTNNKILKLSGTINKNNTNYVLNVNITPQLKLNNKISL